MAKKNPLGCGFALFVAFGITIPTVIVCVNLIYAIFAIPFIKERIYSETGFYIENKDADISILTGIFDIKDFVLENPREPFGGGVFAKGKVLSLKISPFALLLGNIEISELRTELSEINCIRMSKYNLSEFLSKLIDTINIRQHTLSKVDVKIAKATYVDKSTKDTMRWSVDLGINFQRNEINASKALEELQEELDNHNAEFVSRGLAILKSE